MSQDDEFRAPDWVANQPIGAPTEGPTKRQRIWLTISLFFFIPLFLFLGWFEFGRAQQGNWRAWVYTFEWPFFAALSIYLYRKLMHGHKFKIPTPTDLGIKDAKRVDSENESGGEERSA